MYRRRGSTLRAVGIQQAERVGQHLVLELSVTRTAEWPTEREIAPQAAWRRSVGDLVSHRAKRNCCQALCLEDVGERTHGTRAQRSNRCQQNNIDTLFLQPLPTGRTRVHADRAQIELVTGVCEVFV